MMSVMMQAATETAGKGATMTSEGISSALEMIKSIVSWVVSFVADNAVSWCSLWQDLSQWVLWFSASLRTLSARTERRCGRWSVDHLPFFN